MSTVVGFREFCLRKLQACCDPGMGALLEEDGIRIVARVPHSDPVQEVGIVRYRWSVIEAFGVGIIADQLANIIRDEWREVEHSE